jgi:heat shock protein HspQ
MSRNRTVKDKTRRRLTPAARVSPNPAMSDKRRSETKTKPAKKAAKPAAGGTKAAKPAVNAAAKIKARLKSKVAAAKTGAAKTASPPSTLSKAKRPTARAEGPVARPRLRRRADGKRSSTVSSARFAVGDVVRHKLYPFRGVVFDIDPVFANTEEWWLSIPEQMRPKKNQPFYHLLAENAETEYIAYVSEQNLLPDTTGVPVRHPQILDYFIEDEDGRYRAVFMSMLN